MKKALALLLTMLMLLSCLSLASGEAETLSAPENFVFNTETGEFTFTSTDPNAGYYFVRIYGVAGGQEAVAYTASSKRINAGKGGEKSGKVDVSGLGWGQYNIKLITFAASGTGYQTPAPVVLSAFYGVGGRLTRPEQLVVADNNTVEITIDRFNLSDYKGLQYLPIVRVTLWADEALTQEAAHTDVVTGAIVSDTHPTGAYIWPYSLTTGHMNYGAQGGMPGQEPTTQWYCLVPEASFTVEEAGTYYVTAQALTDYEGIIESSQVSEAVAVELNTEAPDFEDFSIQTTSLWKDQPVMGMPTAPVDAAEGRVDAAQGQTTSSMIK